MKVDLELEQDICKAAEEVCYRELKDIECAIAEEGEHDFSKEYRKKIERTIYKRKITEGPGFLHEGQKGRKIKYRYFLLVAILLILSASTALAVGPIREKLVQAFYIVYYDNVEVRRDDVEDLNADSGEPMIVKRPTYIPEGYELFEDDLDESINYLSMRWENEKEELLDYTQYDTRITISTVTSDGSELEQIEINGYDARLVWDNHNNLGTLFYETEEYVYMISGHLSKEELIKILESVN